MSDILPLLTPSECVLLLTDQQAGLAFGVGSTDRQSGTDGHLGFER
jgi:hypothetical protein